MELWVEEQAEDWLNDTANATEYRTCGSVDCFFDKPLELAVQEWPLVYFPYNLAAVATYVVASKFVGPWLMRNREPFDLRNVMQAYNLFQVIISCWLFKEFLVNGWGGYYNMSCQPIDRSPRGYAMAETVWWCFVSKYVEFLDTLFFVLRKRDRQISILHLVHHSLMPIAIGYGIVYTPNGHGTFYGVINSFIHIVMYTYYFLASLGPSVQKFLWWKVHLTKMQLLQFVIVFAHQFQVFMHDCNFSKTIAGMECLFAILLTILFGNFYVQSYLKRNHVKPPSACIAPQSFDKKAD